MTRHALLEDCMAAMSAVAACFPGRFPIETQEAWASRLCRSRIVVADLVAASDELPSRTKRPTLKDFEETIADVKSVRLRREQYAQQAKQLEAPKAMTDEARESSALSARVIMVETRRQIRQHDGTINSTPLFDADARFHELKRMPIEELRTMAAQAAREMDRMNISSAPKGYGSMTAVGQVASTVVGGNTAPRQDAGTPEVLESEDPDDEGVLF